MSRFINKTLEANRGITVVTFILLYAIEKALGFDSELQSKVLQVR